MKLKNWKKNVKNSLRTNDCNNSWSLSIRRLFNVVAIPDCNHMDLEKIQMVQEGLLM